MTQATNNLPPLTLNKGICLLAAARGHPVEALLIVALALGLECGDRLHMTWRVGFEVGWLSTEALAQSDEAQQAMGILTALVSSLLLPSQPGVGSGKGTHLPGGR